MTRGGCERSWQVEAARDDRLDAEALASFKLHRASCAICQTEQQTLDRLALSLSQLGVQDDEMAVRRLRQRTLELANESMLHSPQSRGRSRSVALGLLAGVALVAAGLLLLARPPSSPSSPTSPIAVQVVPRENARWRRTLEENVEQVDLAAGTLLFRVARKPNDPRLLVRLPDGEIEDLGTTFSVTVEGGKTREIVVREGRVLFHRRGAPALHLVAGSTWMPPLEPEPESDTGPRPALAPTAPSVDGEPAPPKPHSVTPHAPARERASARPGAKAVPAGNAEDASYLQILTLLREGRSVDARQAARAYLRMFPAGFRKVEVERVARLRDDGDASADGEPD
ncbi:MAG: hypothetical protein JWN48_134 [Myxococcaceae bacterium]|nr:hypothetical protein [Myxococcaceae bacterium]